MATHSSILAWTIPLDRGAWLATVHRVVKSRTETEATQHACTLDTVSPVLQKLWLHLFLCCTSSSLQGLCLWSTFCLEAEILAQKIPSPPPPSHPSAKAATCGCLTQHPSLILCLAFITRWYFSGSFGYLSFCFPHQKVNSTGTERTVFLVLPAHPQEVGECLKAGGRCPNLIVQ